MSQFKIIYGGSKYFTIPESIKQDLHDLHNKKIDNLIWFGFIGFDKNGFSKIIMDIKENYYYNLEKGINFVISSNLNNDFLKRLLKEDLLNGISLKLLLVLPNESLYIYINENNLNDINQKIDKILDTSEFNRYEIIEKHINDFFNNKIFTITKFNNSDLLEFDKI
jgi:hypothetical protein